MRRRTLFACAAFLVAALSVLGADTGTPTPEPYGPDEFSGWRSDLRRAEIISFGSLPFVTFTSSIYYEVYRWVAHDREDAYLPWIFANSGNAVPLTEREQKNILYASIGISLGVAVIDFSYHTITRAIRNHRATETAPASGPILIEPAGGE